MHNIVDIIAGQIFSRSLKGLRRPCLNPCREIPRCLTRRRKRKRTRRRRVQERIQMRKRRRETPTNPLLVKSDSSTLQYPVKMK
jgi:hypothetical protein